MAQNPAANFATTRGKSPEEAKFFWSGGPVEVAPRTWFASQFSVCTAFETDEGLVLVDTGTRQFAPAIAAMLREKTQADAVREKVASICDNRANAETSLMAINIFNSAAAYTRAGRPFA